MKKYLYRDLYELEDKHWWHIAKRNIVLKLISQHLKTNNPHILDIGCGTGMNLETFKKIGTTYGVDISKDAINFCKKRGLKNLKLVKGEDTKLPPESFDLITALDVLEHTNDNKLTNEIHRLLKKKGIVIITVPAFQWLWSKWDEVLHHKRRYTKKSLANLLKKHHFKMLKNSYMYSFLVLPVFIIRAIKERIFANYYPSDFKLSSPFINRFVLKIAKLESIPVVNSLLPFGTSLICVAQKND